MQTNDHFQSYVYRFSRKWKRSRFRRPSQLVQLHDGRRAYSFLQGAGGRENLARCGLVLVEDEHTGAFLHEVLAALVGVVLVAFGARGVALRVEHGELVELEGAAPVLLQARHHAGHGLGRVGFTAGDVVVATVQQGHGGHPGAGVGVLVLEDGAEQADLVVPAEARVVPGVLTEGPEGILAGLVAPGEVLFLVGVVQLVLAFGTVAERSVQKVARVVAGEEGAQGRQEKHAHGRLLCRRVGELGEIDCLQKSFTNIFMKHCWRQSTHPKIFSSPNVKGILVLVVLQSMMTNLSRPAVHTYPFHYISQEKPL